jgi:hypothetical protein
MQERKKERKKEERRELAVAGMALSHASRFGLRQQAIKHRQHHSSSSRGELRARRGK